ncbi:MAG: hypothetical protein LIQ31_13010 [Planctomycetes bacterium]|nr:hypothetical protein [Planctomycetota bacterium]
MGNNALVVLTPEESKRLIGKAVAAMPEVRKAMTEGIIGFSRCTTNAYVIEEIIGRRMDNRYGYCSGYITAQGMCAVQGADMERLLVLDHGEEKWFEPGKGNVAQFLDRMSSDDIIIKSGNMIDPYGNVACLSPNPGGGEIGLYVTPALTKGIRFIIPMSINKSIPTPLQKFLGLMGTGHISPERCRGLRCGVVPMFGQVVTEVDAIAMLTGAEATYVACGGVASGAAAVVLVITGDHAKIAAAWDLVESVKGEPPMPDPKRVENCDDCYILKNAELGNRCATIKA